MPEATPSRKCADCGEQDGIHDIRKRFLCSHCFIRYVGSKPLKRLGSYRFKNQTSSLRPRLLLPLSGGASSLVLLSILNDQLQRQMLQQNRTAYELVIAHVDTSPSPSETKDEPYWYTEVAERFSTNVFLPTTHISSAFTQDSSLSDSVSHLGVEPQADSSPAETYLSLLSSCTSRTTLADITQILLTRLLVALAIESNCSAILYGHSDTRLAALSLASVAKGRGGAFPGSISDDMSPAHGVGFHYPCRDLFKTELKLYATLVPGGLPIADSERPVSEQEEAKAPQPPPPSIKSQSIDDLLTGYITSQGQRYPNIMANVVRTAGKLQSIESGSTKDQSYCIFCRGLILAQHGGAGDPKLCYGCIRMKQDIRTG